MFYLLVEVYDSSYNEDIYLALQSIGVQKAIVLDAQNISGALSDEQTFFTGFFKHDKIDSGEIQLIQANVESTDEVQEFLDNLKEAGVDIENEKILELTLIPIAASFTKESGFTIKK